MHFTTHWRIKKEPFLLLPCFAIAFIIRMGLTFEYFLSNAWFIWSPAFNVSYCSLVCIYIVLNRKQHQFIRMVYWLGWWYCKDSLHIVAYISSSLDKWGMICSQCFQNWDIWIKVWNNQKQRQMGRGADQQKFSWKLEQLIALFCIWIISWHPCHISE